MSPTPIPTRVAPGATPFLAPAAASPFPPTVPAQKVPCPLDVSEFSASIHVLVALSNLYDTVFPHHNQNQGDLRLLQYQ